MPGVPLERMKAACVAGCSADYRYELPEGEVTPERILALADEVEAHIEGGPAPRPLMR